MQAKLIEHMAVVKQAKERQEERQKQETREKVQAGKRAREAQAAAEAAEASEGADAEGAGQGEDGDDLEIVSDDPDAAAHLLAPGGAVREHGPPPPLGADGDPDDLDIVFSDKEGDDGGAARPLPPLAGGSGSGAAAALPPGGQPRASKPQSSQPRQPLGPATGPASSASGSTRPSAPLAAPAAVLRPSQSLNLAARPPQRGLGLPAAMYAMPATKAEVDARKEVENREAQRRKLMAKLNPKKPSGAPAPTGSTRGPTLAAPIGNAISGMQLPSRPLSAAGPVVKPLTGKSMGLGMGSCGTGVGGGGGGGGRSAMEAAFGALAKALPVQDCASR